MFVSQDENLSNNEKETIILRKLANKYAKSFLDSGGPAMPNLVNNEANRLRQLMLDVRIGSVRELEFVDKAISKLSFRSSDFELLLCLRLKIKRYLQSNRTTDIALDYFWRYHLGQDRQFSYLTSAYFSSLSPNSALERELFKYELMNPLILIKSIDLDIFINTPRVLNWVEFHLREWLGQLAIINRMWTEGGPIEDFQVYRRKTVF